MSAPATRTLVAASTPPRTDLSFMTGLPAPVRATTYDGIEFDATVVRWAVRDGYTSVCLLDADYNVSATSRHYILLAPGMAWPTEAPYPAPPAWFQDAAHQMIRENDR